MSGLPNSVMRILKRWLDELLAPAEDPRQVFDLNFDRQRQLLAKVRQALFSIGAARSRLENKSAELRTHIRQYKEQARVHVEDGREDLARLSLRQAEIASAELQSMQDQLLIIEEDERRLSLIEQQLSAYLEAFYARQEYLIARHRAADAHVQIYEALTGISDELAQMQLVLESAENESERLLARAAAIDRLVEDGLLEIPANHVMEPGDGDSILTVDRVDEALLVATE